MASSGGGQSGKYGGSISSKSAEVNKTHQSPREVLNAEIQNLQARSIRQQEVLKEEIKSIKDGTANYGTPRNPVLTTKRGINAEIKSAKAKRYREGIKPLQDEIKAKVAQAKTASTRTPRTNGRRAEERRKAFEKRNG